MLDLMAHHPLATQLSYLSTKKVPYPESIHMINSHHCMGPQNKRHSLSHDYHLLFKKKIYHLPNLLM